MLEDSMYSVICFWALYLFSKLLKSSNSFAWPSPGSCCGFEEVHRLGLPVGPEPADWPDWKSVTKRFDYVCNPEVAPFWILWTLFICCRFLCLDGWSGSKEVVSIATDSVLAEGKLPTKSIDHCICIFWWWIPRLKNEFRFFCMALSYRVWLGRKNPFQGNGQLVSSAFQVLQQFFRRRSLPS